MYEINGKVVLITGGAAGIGARMVDAFLEGGAKHVAALDVDVANGTVLEKSHTEKYGIGRIKFYKCDVTTEELDAAYDSVLKEHGYIDIVINNAGIMNDRLNAYLKEIEVNVTALIKSSLIAYKTMRKDQGGMGGTIINISSIVGLQPASVLPVYSATKSAVLEFSNCLGTDIHYKRSEVRVITICFGCTDTGLLTTAKMGSIDKETEVLLEEGCKVMPMQTPESAVKGLVHAYKHGASGSTWLVTSNRQAEDITENVAKAHQIMSQGVIP